MKTFQRNAICKAVLAMLGAMGSVVSADAVNINPNGLGQVLLYPYYTVRTSSTSAATGTQNTYVSVTNSSSAAKAVKVRFMEGKNAREVLYFNLFLSAGDVWTGAVVPTTAADSVGVGGAKLISADKSCTYGTVTLSPGIPFSNAAYVGDLGGDSLDRTNEGSLELIEMGVITHSALLSAISHVGGVAPCTAATLAAADAASLSGYLTTATGGLFGGVSIINPSTGVDYTYDAVALDAWDATVGGQGAASTALTPTLASGSITTSLVLFNGTAKTAAWGGLNASRDAVSAAMMRNNVMNEFVLDAATQSGTDWVVTFPTKRFYVTGATAQSRQPFTNTFSASGSCDVPSLWPSALGRQGIFSREEQYTDRPQSGVSPPNWWATEELCWAANVIVFNALSGANSIFGSKNLINLISFENQGSKTNNLRIAFQNGWMKLGFLESSMVLTPMASSSNGIPDATPQAYYGLPVVGFMAQSFINNLISSFGGNFGHKYSLDIR
ncbi:hypothetical protein BH11PSE11_BH11PSE11_02540 [soil metagenome]